MEILVTGACGLVGSHLCDLLLNQGHKVYGIDNLLNGKEENLSDNVHFLEWDVEDKLSMDGLDRIYHLACPASPVHYQLNPIKTMLSNVLGTYNMLELAKRNNARFLFTSSSEVYGDTKNQPINEEQLGENIPTLSGRSCYVEGKRASETLIWNYIRMNHIDGRIARLFNTYGPRMALDDGRVIANFIYNKVIEIHGSGEQRRSFCYVTDTVKGINTLMECDPKFQPKKPINIGNPSGYISIKKLAMLINDMSAENKLIIYKEDRSDSEVFQRIPDISEAVHYLRWSPEVNIIDGLEKTIKEIIKNAKG